MARDMDRDKVYDMAYDMIIEMAEEMIEKGIKKEMDKARAKCTFEWALRSSKELNRSFESMLDDFGISPEERKICMEKYREIVG